MNPKSARHVVIAITLVSCCAVFGAPLGWAAPGAGSEPALTVLNCDGRYARISAGSGATLGTGLYGELTEAQSKIDGCMVADVLDSGRNIIYAVMPESARADENGAQRFFVATLDAGTLKVLHKVAIPGKHAERPLLLSDVARTSFTVASSEAASWQRLTPKANGSFAPAGAAVTVKEAFPTTPFPYINSQGNIADGLRLLDTQGRLIREVRPDSILDSALQEKFASLTQIKNSSQHYYGMIPAAFAADRIVFTVGWDRENNRVPAAGVVVYDAIAGRVVSSFLSAFPVAPGYHGESGVPSLHLTPDGRRVVVEQYEWRARSSSDQRQARFRTGRLAIYDAETGTLVGTVDAESAHGSSADGRVVNFSNDSRYLFYWFDKHLFTIDLEGRRVVSTATLPNGFDPAAVLNGR
jgi:hypothetical protein